jgi:hypothetical protein
LSMQKAHPGHFHTLNNSSDRYNAKYENVETICIF